MPQSSSSTYTAAAAAAAAASSRPPPAAASAAIVDNNNRPVVVNQQQQQHQPRSSNTNITKTGGTSCTMIPTSRVSRLHLPLPPTLASTTASTTLIGSAAARKTSGTPATPNNGSSSSSKQYGRQHPTTTTRTGGGTINSSSSPGTSSSRLMFSLSTPPPSPCAAAAKSPVVVVAVATATRRLATATTVTTPRSSSSSVSKSAEAAEAALLLQQHRPAAPAAAASPWFALQQQHDHQQQQQQQAPRAAAAAALSSSSGGGGGEPLLLRGDGGIRNGSSNTTTITITDTRMISEQQPREPNPGPNDAWVMEQQAEAVAVADSSTPQQSQPPLPPGWVEVPYVDNDNNSNDDDDDGTAPTTTTSCYYYLYEPDGTTQWERPVAAAATTTLQQQEEGADADETAALPPQEEEHDVANTLLLPPGWQEFYADDDDETPYYVYEPDGTTTWDRPLATADDDDADKSSSSSSSLVQQVPVLLQDGDDERLLPPHVDESSLHQVADVVEPFLVVNDSDGEWATAMETELAATAAQLPPGWEEVVDADSGLPYYVYEPDGTTTWDRPFSIPAVVDDDVADGSASLVQHAPVLQDDDDEPLLPVDESSLNQVAGVVGPMVQDIGGENLLAMTTELQTTASTANAQPLPSGWEELVDEDSGLPYYLYEPDGTTTWDRPVPVVDDDDDVPDESASSSFVQRAPVLDDDDDDEPLLPVDESSLNQVAGVVEALVNDSDGEYLSAIPTELSATTTTTVTTVQQLPPGWEEVMDADYGLPYYLYEPDGTTTWDRPVPIPVVDDDIATTPIPMEDDVVMNEDVAGGAVASILPPGWAEAIDADSGMPYYVYEPDGTTTWDRPVAGSDVPTNSETAVINATAIVSETAVVISEVQGVLDEAASDQEISPNEEDMLFPPEEEEEGEENEVSSDDLDAAYNYVAVLPAGWVEVFDDATGRPYYLFEADGTTTWVLPTLNDEVALIEAAGEGPECGPSAQADTRDDVNIDDVAEEDSQYPAISTADFIASNVVPLETVVDGDDSEMTPTTLDLPAGWSAHVDDETGLTYYLCDADGTSSWDLPTSNEITDDKTFAISADQPAPEHVRGNITTDYSLGETKEEQIFLDGSYRPKSSAPEDVANTEGEAVVVTGVDADEGSPRTLPSGWVELIDDASGKPYFYFEADDIATWEHPMLPAIDSRAEDYFIDPPVDTPSRVECDATDAAKHASDFAPEQVYGEASNDLNSAPEETLEVERIVYDKVGRASEPEPPQADDLLPGWAEVVDDATGSLYYYCEADGSTSWDRPTVPVELDLVYERENEHAFSQTESAPTIETSVDDVVPPAAIGSDETHAAPEDTGQEPALPTGWTELADPTSGLPYYYNETTGASSWEWPTEANTDGGESAIGEFDSAASSCLSAEESKPRYDLPDGWVEVPDPSTGASYFYNESENLTTWDRPLPETELRNDLPRTEANASFDEHSMRRFGRQAHAAASFGFGGRLCRLHHQGVSGSVVAIHRTHAVVPGEALARIELAKQHQGLRGPFNASSDKTVAAYIEDKSSTFCDLLWALIATASISQGRLRSMTGVSDPSSPEAMIVNLLLRDNDATNSAANGEGVLSQDSSITGSSLKSVEKLLLNGQRKMAVDEAISSGNFAMALLIASMCDREVHHHAVKCFADRALSEGHPLHTIALLCSGELRPSGESDSLPWDRVTREVLQHTWKRHLAIILSNPIVGWDRLVLLLGDRLADFGDVNAAHFCYMVCGCSVGQPVNPDSRMTLLGCDFSPWDLVLGTDDSVVAFERTEAYEWAKRRGNPNATIPSLQPFKIMYAMLLADFGLEQAAKLYIDNVLSCMEVTREEMHSVKPARGPLSLSVLTSDKNGLLAALNSFDNRLARSIPSDSPLAEKASPIPTADPAEENDVDSSFVTAYTSTKDAVHLTERSGILETSPKKEEKKQLPSSRLSIDESVAHRPDEPTRSMQTPLLPIGEENLLDERHGPVDPPPVIDARKLALDTGFDESPVATANGYPQTPNPTSSQSGAVTAIKPSKPPTAPMSAPPNLGRPKEPAPQIKKKSKFPFEDTIKKWMNPGKEADLGDTMQAYYDTDKKVWVFPGEDPAELAAPIGPPPTTPMAAMSSAISAAPAAGPSDPLAAMMAPPRRDPRTSSGMRPSPASMPLMFPPGMMPATPNAVPKFAVFTPKPDDDGRKENEEPAAD